ncbi:MAG: hypothetical protein P0S94_00835 [Simkaniaceae bacterium]|nr:hypothetical protein [Simkaniaceae bacterium]
MVKISLLQSNNQLDALYPVVLPIKDIQATPKVFDLEDVPDIAQIFKRRIDEILKDHSEKDVMKLYAYMLFADAIADCKHLMEWDAQWGDEMLQEFVSILNDPLGLESYDLPGKSTIECFFSTGQLERAKDVMALVEAGCGDAQKLMAAIEAAADRTPFEWRTDTSTYNPFNVGYNSVDTINEWIEQGVFYDKVREQLDIIHGIRESYRSMIEDHLDDPFYRELYDVLSEGYIGINAHSGISASYIVYDAEGNKRFVLKPIDEDYCCINARPYYSAIEPIPFGDKEPYTTGQTDAFIWELAKIAGLINITPEAHLGIINSDVFWDMSKGLSDERRDEWIKELGSVDFEKLLSVQKYVPESKQLWEVLQELQMEGLSDDEIRAAFDQDDYEKAMLLELLSGDTDGHFGNFLAYIKGVSLDGNPIYGIQVIDNSYSFQSNNNGISNNLAYLPNADVALSDDLKKIILGLDVDGINQMIDNYGLEYGKEAFERRVEVLQNLVRENSDLTVGQLYTEFRMGL